MEETQRSDLIKKRAFHSLLLLYIYSHYSARSYTYFSCFMKFCVTKSKQFINHC